MGLKPDGKTPNMKLFDMHKAPNPRRVRIFLAEKGISLPMEQVDIQAGDNLKPHYLAINPRGVLPTLLLDDGSILDESMAICRYFEMVQPEPNLFGRDPLEAAQVEQWQRRMEFDGMYNIAAAFRNGQPAYAGRAQPGAGPETAQIPALAARGAMLAAAWLDGLEARLEGRDYLAATRFTVADITAFVCIDFARWIGLRAGEAHPNILAYHARIKARPSSQA